MDKTTEKYADYATSLSYADLTPGAVHAVKRSVVDSIGCAFGAFNAGPPRAVRKLASQLGAVRPATVIGTEIRSSPEWAGFANGVMIRYLDFSDDYFGGTKHEPGPHPSDNIGSVMATAESAGVDGKTLILGIALAYEACDHLTDHVDMRAHGWDYATLHAVGTCLGAGKIMGLSREQLGNAVSLAVVPNICLRQTRLGELANWKGLAGPNGSRNGLVAALLAREGITGPPEPFEGKAGFMTQLGSPFQLGTMGGNGVPFKIEGTYFKSIPIMYSMQLPVSAALQLRSRVGLQDIDSLRVYLHGHALDTGGFDADRWEPGTRESADHSGPYVIAAALSDGEITDQTFAPERFRDPAVLALMKKISAEEDREYTAAFPRASKCRIEATLKSGEVVTVLQTNHKGHPADPMSDRDIEEKFLKLASDLITAKQSRTILDGLWNLEKADDLSKLFVPMVVQDRGR
ncbi:MAG: MmgE/PrpD family protein [Chloroflexota bacterium]